MTNILFLTLKVFTATGGIEKVCRVAGKALYEYAIEKNKTVQIYSMHDDMGAGDNNKYFPSEIFKGYGARKMKFIQAAIQKGKGCDVVILSHINMLVIGWMIKKISPSTKLLLFAHGIEIWNKLTPRKRMMLDSCDQIISVSSFTSDKIQSMHGVDDLKCRVLNNCLDPYLPLSGSEASKPNLRARYGFSATDKILFTLTRLSAKERYKGYDNVMRALVSLKEDYPGMRYLLAGSYDVEEKQYLDAIIEKLHLSSHVFITGFLAEEELAAHFAMADVYVMPSVKEGFGIVFIEAMYYGLPVIAGNKDGSVDALCNGKLGLLVDPVRIEEITTAIKKILENKTTFTPNRKMLIEQFGYDKYKRRIAGLLESVDHE